MPLNSNEIKLLISHGIISNRFRWKIQRKSEKKKNNKSWSLGLQFHNNANSLYSKKIRINSISLLSISLLWFSFLLILNGVQYVCFGNVGLYNDPELNVLYTYTHMRDEIMLFCFCFYFYFLIHQTNLLFGPKIIMEIFFVFTFQEWATLLLLYSFSSINNNLTHLNIIKFLILRNFKKKFQAFFSSSFPFICLSDKTLSVRLTLQNIMAHGKWPMMRQHAQSHQHEVRKPMVIFLQNQKEKEML